MSGAGAKRGPPEGGGGAPPEKRPPPPPTTLIEPLRLGGISSTVSAAFKPFLLFLRPFGTPQCGFGSLRADPKWRLLVPK